MAKRWQDLTHEERLELWRAEQAAHPEERWRGRMGLAGIQDFLTEGGRYGVAVEDAGGAPHLAVIGSSTDGRRICWSPYILQPDLLTAERASDLGEILDVFLAFYMIDRSRDATIGAFLNSLHVDPDLFMAAAYVPAADLKGAAWAELHVLLGRPEIYPHDWTRTRRRGYIQTSIENRLKKIHKKTRKEHALVDGEDDLDTRERAPLDPLAGLQRQRDRAWLFGDPRLTERDRRVMGLLLDGHSPAEASRLVGGPGLSPWVALRQKQRRRGAPEK